MGFNGGMLELNMTTEGRSRGEKVEIGTWHIGEGLNVM